MYIDYFGFSEAPFSISPDPRYLFMSERHQEALAHLLYGLQIDGGFVLLTGEVGTGKTTLCRCLLEQVPEHCDIAFIFNPKLTSIELLKTLCEELHIAVPESAPSLKLLIDRLNAHLLQSNAGGRKTVLIIDEAQNLSPAVLELLRLLTNLETHRHKLLQIILLGQPELRDIVGQPGMRQLAQRIVARYHLEPLSRPEVGAYVQHRLAVAGAHSSYFSQRVLDRLYALSNGTPRLINLICDRALLGAYVQGKPLVEPATLERAAREVLGPPAQQERPAKWREAMVAILIPGLLASLLAAAYYHLPERTRLAGGAAGKAATQPILASRPFEPAHGVDADDDPAADSGDSPPEEPPRPEPSDPSDEAIVAPSEEDYWLQEAQAVRALFGHWQAAIRQPADIDNACRQVREMGLDCLRLSGDPDALRRLSAPAILELQRPDGAGFLATLLDLKGDRAQIVVAGSPQEVRLGTLIRQWNGRYLQLRQAPLADSRRLAVGARGAEVAWVDLQLARWEGSDALRAGNPRFTPELEQRVRHFQQAHSLLADGVIGPQTLERLARVAPTKLSVAARRVN